MNPNWILYNKVELDISRSQLMYRCSFGFNQFAFDLSKSKFFIRCVEVEVTFDISKLDFFIYIYFFTFLKYLLCFLSVGFDFR
jgi:hypothetical protein